MTNNLDEFDKKLAELLTHTWNLDKEDLFNLGVEVGRELAMHNIATYRSPIWAKLESENKQVLEIYNAAEKIENFIATLVKLSVTEHINETGSWSIAKRGGFDKFSDEIVEKYNVQVLHCDMESHGGDFTVTFSIENELAKLFDKHNIYNEFTVNISNYSGDEHQTIYDAKEVDSYIDSVSARVRNINGWKLGNYEEFLNEISKPFVFLIAQNIK